jgi:GxxExxY protein
MSPKDINEIIERIIGCAHTVSNTLGIGFVEKVYENALVYSIRKTGMLVDQQYPIKVDFEGVVVGVFFADLLVEKRVLVELQAVAMLNQEHTAEALNHLRAIHAKVCLLINFGSPKVEIKRLLPSVSWRAARP